MDCVLVSLVQILVDPATRTIEGFSNLIDKDWVQAGYSKFAKLNLT